jgi:hypothetical protein
MSKTISRAGALKYIAARAGKIFSVQFVKRTTGELRTMTCRQGVKAHLAANPSRPGVDFKANDLIPVFDVHAPAPKGADRERGAYRSIPKEGITAVMIDGQWYTVNMK